MNRQGSNEDDIVHIIKTELHDKDVTVIDDFHKLLVQQKKTLDNDIKSRINTNQKNILQLTDDLRITQEELVALRILTKELYQILAEFAEAAERRLAIEKESHRSQAPQTYNGNSHQELAVPNKRKDRLSVLVLQKMWATELQSLFKHVDGAQKNIPPIPGRHVLAESGRWHEINIGTWKASRPIHLFLLNDLVLVATRKLPQEGNAKRLQAIHCWPLLEVEISEIKAPVQVTSRGDGKIYVINLRAPSFSYVYQTDRSDHFSRVINAFHKGKAELAQRNRQHEEEEQRNPRASGEYGFNLNGSSASLHDDKLQLRQLRESLRNSGLQGHSRSGSTEEVGFNRRSSGHRQGNDVVLQDISAIVHSRNRSHDFKDSAIKKPGTDRLPNRLFLDLKNAEDKLDEVDVDLAHNNYSQATQLMTIIDQKVASIVLRIASYKAKEVDESFEELRILVDVVRLKLSNRKLKVQQNLQFDLQHNIQTYTNETVLEILGYYTQLDMQSEGIAAILEALSSHLSKTVGKLISNAHGSTKVDIINYLANLTIIYVLIIRRALQIYGDCIEHLLSDSRNGVLDSSGFITWCISEMSQLVEIFKKHAEETLLFKEGKIWYVKDQQHYHELISIIVPQLAFLKKEGLNVDYLFEDILYCQVKA